MRPLASLAPLCLGIALAVLPHPRARAGFGFSEPVIVNTTSRYDSAYDYYQSVDTDGTGVWIVVWYSFGDPKAPWGSDADVLFARSTDDGVTWSDPAPLSITATTDFQRDGVPFIRASANGTWIVAWESENPLDGSVNDWDILFSRSTNHGLTWSAPAMLNSTAPSDSAYDGIPRLDTGGAGTWVLTWASLNSLGGTIGDDFDILYSRSTDDGLTWSPAAVLNSNAATNNNAGYLRTSTVCGGDGKWVTVWTTRDNPDAKPNPDYDIFASHSTDNGASWSPMVPIMADWDSDTADDGEVTAPQGASFVNLAVHDQVWIAVWASRGALGGSLGDDTDILYARSVDVGATWSPAQPLSSNASSDPAGPAGNDFYPEIRVDPNGTWICVWSTTAFSAPDYNDLNIAVSRSTNQGVTWTPISPLNFNQRTDKRGYDEIPFLARGSNGTWICTWRTEQRAYGSGYGDILCARTTDALQPIEPPLSPEEIKNAILGRYDANGDGVLDVTDLVLLLDVH